MTTTIITKADILSNDVLCGKNKDCLNWPGSIRFREIIDTFVPNYKELKTKYSKMMVTKEIYEKVTKDARFLKWNEAEQVYEELSIMAARDKIGHSLRFSSRAKRRHQKKNTNNKRKPTHKRSGSASSSSSSESESCNPFATDTLVGLFQQAAAATAPTIQVEAPTMEEESSLSSLSNTYSSIDSTAATATVTATATATETDALDEFLNLELKFDPNNNNNNNNNNAEVDVYNSMDDLKLLIEEGNIASSSDPLDNFMDDILNVVKAIEKTEIIQTAETQEESLLSLLSEPVGEWEEDRSVEL